MDTKDDVDVVGNGPDDCNQSMLGTREACFDLTINCYMR